jgi:uncharacterized protein with LGFP repeats
MHLGGPNGVMGNALSDELDTNDGNGRYNKFQNGYIIWKRGTSEAFAVWGAIAIKYESLGREAVVGYPIADEETIGTGKMSRFDKKSRIYWSTTTSAYVVYGAILDKYILLGEPGVNNPLGFPVTDEADTLDVNGRVSFFQNGAIYWKRGSIEAYAIWGGISKRYFETGRELGHGYPITDELPAANGGRYNAFDKNNYIFWYPSIGAKLVYGGIAMEWIRQGRELSFLGYPITDEYAVGSVGCRESRFQGGYITWCPNFGITSVRH